jgi:Domain of unknown function (DUF4157)
MSDRVHANVQAQQKTVTGSTPQRNMLQRTCACGQHTIAGSQCSACRSGQSMLHRSQRAFEPPSAVGAVPSNSPAQENALSSNSAFDRASRFGYDFSRIPIHSPAAGVIQTKLAINEPGDQYEQEADRISQQVMRMPEPQLQRACACGGACAKCQMEQVGQEHERLQTKRVQASDTGQTTAPPIVHDVLRSPGQPLDAATRGFMEPRFGYDFSRVRVHTGATAEQSAHDVEALAYTVGHDIVFGAGRFVPGTQEGQRLLAHELTHVVQQSGTDGIRVDQSDKERGLFSVSHVTVPAQASTTVESAERALMRTPRESASFAIPPAVGPGALGMIRCGSDDKQELYFQRPACPSCHQREERGNFSGWSSVQLERVTEPKILKWAVDYIWYRAVDRKRISSQLQCGEEGMLHAIWESYRESTIALLAPGRFRESTTAFLDPSGFRESEEQTFQGSDCAREYFSKYLSANWNQVITELDRRVAADPSAKSILLPTGDKILIKMNQSSTPLFKPISKRRTWSLVRIPLGSFGWVNVKVTAGFGLAGLLSYGWSDGVLSDICLYRVLDSHRLGGNAQFKFSAALSPSVNAKGMLEVEALYVDKVKLVGAKGLLDVSAIGTLNVVFDSRVRLSYDRSKDKWDFDSEALIFGTVGLQVNATVWAAIKLFSKEIWHKQWTKDDFHIGWTGGLRVGTDTRPHFVFGSVGMLSKGATSAQPGGPSLPTAVAPDPLATEATVDDQEILEASINTDTGAPATVPRGLKPDDSLPIIWYKPLNIYPEEIAIPRANSPHRLVRDAGPTLVEYRSGKLQKTVSDSIGVGKDEVTQQSNWPWKGKKFQCVENTEGDRVKDLVRKTFNEDLLPAGHKLSGYGYDVDHVHEKQFGGRDSSANLWPAKSDPNRTAGWKHQKKLNECRTTIGDITNRWFEIADIENP